MQPVVWLAVLTTLPLMVAQVDCLHHRRERSIPALQLLDTRAHSLVDMRRKPYTTVVQDSISCLSRGPVRVSIRSAPLQLRTHQHGVCEASALTHSQTTLIRDFPPHKDITTPVSGW